MTRQKAVQRLFTIWAVAALLLSLLLTAQSVGGKYGEDYPIAFSWFLALVVPQLSVLGVAAFGDPKSRWKSAAADAFRYRWALWGSIVVIAMASATVLIEPMLAMSPFELFNRTGIVLSICQGLVLAAVGSVVFEGR